MATLNEKARLLAGLLHGERAFVGPFYVTVDVTRRCNRSCPGCRFHSREVRIPSPGDQTIQDLPFPRFERLCPELARMGTRELILLGEGEPLLHPRLFEMIVLAKREGFIVHLFTNGTLLTEQACESLIESGLDRLKVSCWASSKEAYLREYPGADNGTFEAISRGMRRLSELKARWGVQIPTVIVHQPLHRNNYCKIHETVELAQACGCDGVSFSPFKTRRGALAHFALRPGEENEVVRTLQRLKRTLGSLALSHTVDETLARYQIGEAVWDKLPCYMGWVHAHIKVDGSVQACNPCDLSLGSLEERSFTEIWNGPEFRRFRRRTLTRTGLRQLGCDCGFCCHVGDSLKVHRLFRWLSPRPVLSVLGGYRLR